MSETAAVPVLRVVDAEAAVRWWARLGFSEEFRHRFEPGFPLFVGVRRDGTQVFLSEHTGDAPGPALVYLWVDDTTVDAVAADFGVRVDDMPWARDCEVTDPDGNRVRVAAPRD